MEIKTIWNIVDNATDFDMRVNEALAKGWHLVKREVLPGERYTDTRWGNRLLYAELVKVDEPAEPVTWQEAAQVLKSTCSENDTCDTCKLREWCDEYLARGAEPQEWEVPAT